MADIPKANEIKQEVEEVILRADDGEVGAVIQNRGLIMTSAATIKEKLKALRANLDDWLADANLTAGNIKNGVKIFGVTGTFPNDGTAQTDEVLTGKTFYNNSATKRTGTMPNQGRKIITPGTTNIAIPAGYHDGTGYVQGDSDLKASNIRNGVNLFGVIGTLTPGQVVEGSVKAVNGVITISGLPGRPVLCLLGVPRKVAEYAACFVVIKDDTVNAFTAIRGYGKTRSNPYDGKDPSYTSRTAATAFFGYTVNAGSAAGWADIVLDYAIPTISDNSVSVTIPKQKDYFNDFDKATFNYMAVCL